MGRGKKFIIGVLVAALLVVGVIGGVALAADDGLTGDVVLVAADEEGDSGSKTLLERVAEILGLDSQTVKDAFSQARSEMREESLKDRLDALVEEGKITQEQADEYWTWWQSKPDMTPYREWLETQPDLGLRGQSGGRGLGGVFRGGWGWLQ